jgi:hypothetical protein
MAFCKSTVWIFLLAPAVSLAMQISPQLLKQISLKNLISGQQQRIDLGRTPLTVVVFVSATCLCSKDHETIVNRLHQQFPKYQFFAIHSNTDENTPDLLAHFSSQYFSFPVLQDDHAKLADLFRANKTPHSYVLTPQGNVLYQGGVTDSHNANSAKQNYLQLALQQLSQGQNVAVSEAKTLGCVIAR